MDRLARFASFVRAGPILLDSAMGTRLLGQVDGATRGCLALANLDCPHAVLQNHRDDIDAGSDAILTNSFGADRENLERAGRGSDFLAVNRESVVLARMAACADRLVIGSVTPLATRAPQGAYRDQARALIEAGCDALILETQLIEGALIALRALTEEFSMLPVLVTLWRWPDDAIGAARQLEDLGASAIGTNCGRGLNEVMAASGRVAHAVAVPLIAKPSAGLPDSIPAAPESFGLAVAPLKSMGVSWLGGCCGTTPAHIAAMRRELGPAVAGSVSAKRLGRD